MSNLNTSGILPVEFKVLVLPEETEEKTKGGIILPGDVKTRADMAQVKALLVATGGQAFSDWKGRVPEVGERVYIAKYAGLVAEGADGKSYRIINDKDCAAIITK